MALFEFIGQAITIIGGGFVALIIIVGLVTGFIGYIVNPLLKAFTGWDLD